MKIRIDMTGLRYGRLVGVSFAHKSRSGHAHWLFLCDCGNEVVAAGGNVRSGSTASCGCLHREISAARLTEHGHRARKRHDATYRAWQRMKMEHDSSTVLPVWFDDYARCLIPRFDGAILPLEWKEAVWDRYVTGAPRPRTPSEQQYSDRKLRSRR